MHTAENRGMDGHGCLLSSASDLDHCPRSHNPSICDSRGGACQALCVSLDAYSLAQGHRLVADVSLARPVKGVTHILDLHSNEP